MMFATNLSRFGGSHRTHFAEKFILRRNRNGEVYTVFEGEREVECGSTTMRPLIRVEADKDKMVSYHLIGKAKTADPRDVWMAIKILIDAIDKEKWDEKEEGYDYEEPKGMRSYKEGGVTYVGIDRGEGFYAIGVDEQKSFYCTDPKIPLAVLRCLLYPMERLCGWDKAK